MQVAAGGAHFLALLPNGDVYAWGANNYGQVGDGSTTDRSIPSKVLRGILSIAAGFNHSVAVSKNGEMFAWGCNGSGQIGDGTQENRLMPTTVSTALNPLFEVLHAAAGKEHTLAVVRQPGYSRTHCYGWGSNVSGVLACQKPSDVTAATLTGMPQLALYPVMVCEDVAVVAAGMTHALAVRSNGDLVAWGRNNNGQLGDGSLVNRLSGVKVLERVRSISAGVDYSLAIVEPGDLYAWGCNRGGRLGDGTCLDRLLPVRILTDIRAISAGHYHALAVTGEGQCLAWGRNLHGSVCDKGAQEVPFPIEVVSQVVAVSAGASGSIASLPSGDMSVWGRNWHGQVSCFHALEAAQVATSFMSGPSNEAFAALENEECAKKVLLNGSVALGPTDSKPLAQLLDVAAGAATQSGRRASPVFTTFKGIDFSEEEPWELPPPKGWKAPDSAPESNGSATDPGDTIESCIKDDVAHVEAVGEIDYQILVDQWRSSAVSKHGPGVHLRVHLKAKQLGRQYILNWNDFRKDAYANSDGKALNPDHEEQVLASFQSGIVLRAFEFRKDNEKAGGAMLFGWTAEDCDALTGVVPVCDVLCKAASIVSGTEELFDGPPPGFKAKLMGQR